MISQTGLIRAFRARVGRQTRDTENLRRRGREFQDALEDTAIQSRREKLPRHLVTLPGSTQMRDNAYALLRYLGRVGDREYYFDYVESSVERAHSWDTRLYVAPASRRRPVKVARVPSEHIDERLVRLILGAVSRTFKRRLPELRIPRGYYPYGYFFNWTTERWGRRKCHTIYRSGIIVAPRGFRQACRQLTEQWDCGRTSVGVDSLYVMTGNGRLSLEPVLDGHHAYALTPEFFKRGRLKITCSRGRPCRTHRPRRRAA